MPGPEAAVARVGWVEVGGDIGDGAQGCRARGNRCPVCLTSLASHHTRSDANILSNFGERGSHVKNIENSVSSDNIMRSQKKINFNNCLSTNVKIMAALVLLFILYI